MRLLRRAESRLASVAVWSCSCATVLETRRLLSAPGFIKLANASAEASSLSAECNVRPACGGGQQALSSETAPCWGIVRQNRTLVLQTRAGFQLVLHGHDRGAGAGPLLAGFSETRRLFPCRLS